jgi:hypothetical protein
MTSIIRPYADLEGIFSGLQYRANAAEPFKSVPIENDDASTIVRVDDLRTIPQDELRIDLNQSALKPYYEEHQDKLRLVIIARDTVLRRELRLCDYPLDEVPSTISLNRALLRTTSLRDALPLQVSIVLGERLKGDAALPSQRASRLAELTFLIRNSAGGATFPLKRATAEEFKDAGLPSETGIHLDLKCEPEELIKAVDWPMANLLQVWVHEKIWDAIDRDRGAVASRIRLTSIALTAVHLLLSTVVPLMRKGEEIEEASVIGQLLSYAEHEGSLEEGHLRRQLQEDAALHKIEPWLQNAWRLVSVAGKIDEDSEEPQ